MNEYFICFDCERELHQKFIGKEHEVCGPICIECYESDKRSIEALRKEHNVTDILLYVER